MYIEGGLYSGIVKKGITDEQEKKINKSQLTKCFLLGLGLIGILCIYNLINIKQNITLLVIFCFYLCSLFRVFIYTKEAVFVASGNYLYSETINFFVTCIVYGLTFLALFYTEIPGFYALCIFHLGFILFYGLSLQFLGRGFVTENNSDSEELQNFSIINRNSSILFTLSGRVDELSASFLFSSNNLGIFSKIKEISIMIGTFSSRILSRPWYYIACNIAEKRTYIYHLLSLSLFVLGLFLFFPLIEMIIDLMINIMGENWEMLHEFSFFIIIIFFTYLLTEYTRGTLVATGAENFVLKLEKYFLLFRIMMYVLVLILVRLAHLTFEVYDILVLELFIRVGYFLIQTYYFLFKFFKKLNKNDWKTNT